LVFVEAAEESRSLVGFWDVSRSNIFSTKGYCSRLPFLASQGQYFALACNKSGSRALDGLWDRGSFRSKEFIAAELAEKETALRSDFIGKFVHRKVAFSF